MGMLIEGLNKILNLFSTLMNAAEIGTGTNTETGADTDLQTVISGSETTRITTTTADQFLKKEARFVGTSSSGESVTECIFKTQSPEKAQTRVTFTAATWNTSSDILITSRWYAKGRND